MTADFADSAAQRHLGQRLLASYDSMPRGERRLADLLLEDIGVVRLFPAGELAGRAGVSKATAARLFRRLGYASYREAQKEVRDLGRPDGRLVEPPLFHGGNIQPGAYLDAEVKHLVRTFEALPAEGITEAVRLIRNGRKLWVVGFGEDYPIALFARALLIRVLPDIRMIPLSGFPVPEEFASIDAEDTMLAFGVGRRSGMLRNVIGSSRRAGARLVLVTRTIAAGDKRGADVILRGRCDGPTVFGSMTATVSLVTYLCARVAAKTGEPGMQRLQHIEVDPFTMG